MYKCLRIMFRGSLSSSFLRDFIQKSAREFSLEGAAQLLPEEDRISIVVCGQKDNIDLFLDAFHAHIAAYDIDQVEIEPYMKVKDYRGVFRVID